MVDASPRIERLLVLAGDTSPQRQFELREAYFTEDDANAPRVMEFAVQHSVGDIIFTDRGVYFAAYGAFPYSGSTAKLGMSLASGIHGIALGASEAAQRKLATKRYRSDAPSDQKKTVRERYESRGMFLPSDEITAVELKNNLLTITFRDKLFNLTAPELKDITEEQLVKWWNTSKDRRCSQSKAPVTPTVHALLEWSQRTVETVPEWVDDAIRGVANDADWNIADPELSKIDVMMSLVARLETMKSPDAQTLRSQVLTKVVSKKQLAAKLCLALSAVCLIFPSLFVINMLRGIRPVMNRMSVSQTLVFPSLLILVFALGAAVYYMLDIRKTRRSLPQTRTGGQPCGEREGSAESVLK